MKKTKKINLLVWGDSPDCSTGFATVIRGIFNYLAKTGKYEIDIIGINDRGGWKNPKKYPYRIYPARLVIDQGGDFFGRPRLVASLLGKDPDLSPPWDLVFILNDPFVLEEPLPVFGKGTFQIVNNAQETYKKKLPPEWWFKTIFYIPIDSEIKGNWVENSVNLADFPVAYCEFGKREIIEADEFLDKPTKVDKKLKVIYHGVDLNVFKPIPKKDRNEVRKKFFGGRVKDETFLVVSIARNQLRKDLPRTLAIFSEFIKRRPDSFLYLNCQESDAWGSLREYARNWPNLEYGKNWGVPANFSANIGLPIEALNLIYNEADCVFSTSLGEGMGFHNLEGMATKTVVISPNNTTTPELFGYDKDEDISDMDSLSQKVRGVPIKCQSTKSEWATYGVQDKERIRPLANVDDAVEKLLWVYDNPDKVKIITDRAYKWIQDYSWDKIGRQWDELFTKAYSKLEKERKKYEKPVQNDSDQQAQAPSIEPKRDDRANVKKA